MKKQKAKTTDFTINDMPHNRIEVFFDCIKNEWRKIINCCCLLFLFSLPLLISLLLKDTILLSMVSNNEAAEAIKSTKMLFSLIHSLCLLIFSIGLAGFLKIIKLLSWQEPVFIKTDFMVGIKENAKECVMISVIASIILIFTTYIDTYINSSIVYLLFAVALLILLPITILTVYQSIIYKDSLMALIRNSFIFYIKSLFKTLLASLIAVAPILITLLLTIIGAPITVIGKYITYSLYFLIYLPISLFCLFLYCCSVFDKVKNKKYFPKIYDKGVYRKSEEEQK